MKIRPGSSLERGHRTQLAPGTAQKLQEDENHGSWTPLGTLPWVSFKSCALPSTLCRLWELLGADVNECQTISQVARTCGFHVAAV